VEQRSLEDKPRPGREKKPDGKQEAFVVAQAFLQVIRDHWQIENSLHWVLDIAFREDDSCIRKNHHAPHNIALMRHIALNLLKQDTSAKVGIATRRQRAGWDNDYPGKIICL
jgi:hypothetical protein